MHAHKDYLLIAYCTALASTVTIRTSYAGSVAHHLLAQYYNSMCAVIFQQFHNKIIHGGMEGILEMCMETPMLAALLEDHMGLPLRQMQEAVASLKRGECIRIATAKQPKLSFYVRDSTSTTKRRTEDGCVVSFGCCGSK